MYQENLFFHLHNVSEHNEISWLPQQDRLPNLFRYNENRKFIQNCNRILLVYDYAPLQFAQMFSHLMV